MSFSELFQRKAAGRHVTGDGDEEWYDDKERLHRDGDLPAVTDSFGGKAWYRHGLLHRDGGRPAIEAANGDRAWYAEGKLDRRDGPAVVYADKNREPEYWRDGREMTDAERAAIDPAFAAKIAAAEGQAAASKAKAGTQNPVTPLRRISFR